MAVIPCAEDRPLLGLLGGMGPHATADFYQKLINLTLAGADQDHLPVLIISDPRVPDRSLAIESKREQPVLEALVVNAERLRAAGAKAIAIPCNTAHHWLARLRARVKVPFFDIVRSSVAECRRRFPHGGQALVLATQGTRQVRLYDEPLARGGFKLSPQSPKLQALVQQIIAAVKSGELARAQADMAALLASPSLAADVILLACTELPIAARSCLDDDARLIDTTAALAVNLVQWASGSTDMDPEVGPQ